jgi:hypothetical protein
VQQYRPRRRLSRLRICCFAYCGHDAMSPPPSSSNQKQLLRVEAGPDYTSASRKVPHTPLHLSHFQQSLPNQHPRHVALYIPGQSISACLLICLLRRDGGWIWGCARVRSTGRRAVGSYRMRVFLPGSPEDSLVFAYGVHRRSQVRRLQVAGYGETGNDTTHEGGLLTPNHC